MFNDSARDDRAAAAGAFQEWEALQCDAVTKHGDMALEEQCLDCLDGMLANHVVDAEAQLEEFGEWARVVRATARTLVAGSDLARYP